MKHNYFIISLLLFIGMAFSSCIKSEELNTEADIETAIIPAEYTKLPTQITNEEVTFFVNAYADITNIAPEFTVTEGATIEPASGTKRDFTKPQFYTVTSQNKAYTKTYIVSMISTEFSKKYSFEDVEVSSNGAYYEWYEKADNDNKIKLWATANAGFNLSYLFASGKPNKDNFLTTIEPEGKIGKGIKLQTLKTGKTGAKTAPISAGNLFLGIFETNISKPIESPRFGINWNDEPLKITGYYKYQAGPNFEVNDKEGKTNLTKDTFDAYAIFFKKDHENDYLKATHDFKFLDDLASDPRIISYARINPEEKIETEEWTRFELPFIKLPGREIETDQQYMLAIVFSSSLEGAQYNGAIGSILSIDEVEVITEKKLDKK
ncbi:PCMD domain-containing protein [Myroides injenensis]|uniref:PCMD domain-containing protein n=1 Tax=Myroides injenensis TaxID=1183151 RepID=UPI00226EF162|nr:PCMD domain-containing protein [Myroides injenensis]